MPAGVDQHLAVRARLREHVGAAGADLHHLLPHHLREADQLLDGLALHPERGEERGDLGVRRRPGHDGLHRRRRLDPREVARGPRAPHRLGDDRAGHGVSSRLGASTVARARRQHVPDLERLGENRGPRRAPASSLLRDLDAEAADEDDGQAGRERLRTARASSQPVMPGIARSVKNRSNGSALHAGQGLRRRCPRRRPCAPRRPACRPAPSPTASSSSTTRQRSGHRPPARRRRATRRRGGPRRIAGRRGTACRKVVPCPSSLSTVMSPVVAREDTIGHRQAEAGALRPLGREERVEDLARARPRECPSPCR